MTQWFLLYFTILFLEPDTAAMVKNRTLSAESVGGKRKRRSEEEEMSVKVAKKQRANSSEELVSSVNPQRSKRGSRMRRAQRFKPEKEQNDNTKPSSKSEEDPVTIILDEDTEKKGLNQLFFLFLLSSIISIVLINLLDAQLLIIL